MDVSYDAARDELEDTLRRLVPALTGVDDALLAEWTLVLGVTDGDGVSEVRLVTGPTTLISHSLGALRFAQVVLEADLLAGGG